MDKREKNRINNKIKRDERRKAGLCIYCGKENDRKPKPACSVCVKKQNEYKYIWSINRILDLTCPMCGNAMKEPNWKCPDCHQKIVESMRIVRARKEAKKICLHCANPAEEGHKLCSKCLKPKRRIKKDNE